jgi:hypothetical protein
MRQTGSNACTFAAVHKKETVKSITMERLTHSYCPRDLEQERAVEIGLDEGRAVSAEAVHDDVEVFRRCRNERGPITHDATPSNRG